jgi:hypothetical protein
VSFAVNFAVYRPVRRCHVAAQAELNDMRRQKSIVDPAG